MALNEHMEEIFKMREDGRSMKYIGESYGVTTNAISRALLRWGNPPTMSKEQRKKICRSIKKYWARNRA